jgi:phosphatidylethanolamine N-methyltransferase
VSTICLDDGGGNVPGPRPAVTSSAAVSASPVESDGLDAVTGAKNNTAADLGETATPASTPGAPEQSLEADPDDSPSPTSSPEGDPDDFIIMDEQQATRIAGLCEQAIGVELSADVVVADANVGALVQRILGARSLAGKGLGAEA